MKLRSSPLLKWLSASEGHQRGKKSVRFLYKKDDISYGNLRGNTYDFKARRKK
jgi:hypothetical protein